MAGFIKAVAALVFAGAACAFASALACEPSALSDEAPSATSRTNRDVVGRAVAPISINGHGPYRFIIDTGANRSVVSETLATQLGLAHSGVGLVHSIDGVQEAALVSVDSLSFGGINLSRGATPVLDGPMLAGEHGVLGVDGMAGRVLHVDFARRCVEIFDSASQLPMVGWVTINARMRFGTLLVAEGRIQGVRVNVLIDTGASVSLANERFRQALRHVAAESIEYHGDHAFTFGRPVVLERTVWTPRLSMGRTYISGVGAYIGDFHIFDLWGLRDEPTLLIGMDVLARSREMAIDYQNGLVHFRERPRGAW
jgi:predicted aspartyl protease